jgi:hypothetical protein
MTVRQLGVLCLGRRIVEGLFALAQSNGLLYLVLYYPPLASASTLTPDTEHRRWSFSWGRVDVEVLEVKNDVWVTRDRLI